MLFYPEDELRSKKGIDTAREIIQQPGLWSDVFSYIRGENETIQEFLDRITKRFSSVRVIFTGAGTSAYVGDTITPILRKISQGGGLSFESIPTTDIVADPLSYLVKTQPTLLVSFARSGNSPESVAAVKVAQKVIDHCFFITVTCNKSGALAQEAVRDDLHLLVAMPDASNDKGFAMTSSFTCMLYSAYLMFFPQTLEHPHAHQELWKAGELFIRLCEKEIPAIHQYHFSRVIYLGSSALGNLCHEAALKCLELNAGTLDTYHESSMGFRHGPKSLQTDDSLIILFVSADQYTRSYDRDIAREVSEEPVNSKVIVLCADQEAAEFSFADQLITFNKKNLCENNDLFRSLLYILFGQLFAFYHSLSLGITPDNPSPDGKVNRVVRGVSIYRF